MIERTIGQIIVVADHSKWGVVSNFQIATIDEVDILVSDEALDQSALDSLKKHSIEGLIAKASTIDA